MKVLVGAACLAIIAAVAYFFWCEYQAAQRAQARAQVATLRQECLAASGLKTFDEDKVRSCLLRGLVTEAEVRAELHRR